MVLEVAHVYFYPVRTVGYVTLNSNCLKALGLKLDSKQKKPVLVDCSKPGILILKLSQEYEHDDVVIEAK
jgi:hypothetical protein